MNSVFQFAGIKRSPWLMVIVLMLAGMVQITRADTIVSIDFDDTSDLQSLFNPDSSPYLFNQAQGGVGNTGVINSSAGQNTGDIWTSKTGYSVNGPRDSYRLSAFFYLTTSRGHSGLGIATSNANEPQGSGNTTSGIGYIATDEVVTIISSIQSRPTAETFHFQLDQFSTLFPDSWYHFEVTIISKPENTFDVSIAISEATAGGQIGSVVTVLSETGIVNTDIGQAETIHPYLSINATSGSRFSRVDELTMRLSGGPVVVPDPEADTDMDGELDSVDPDDDNDGAFDEVDKFPLDENEFNDNDNDGIGDVEDRDDDNDGILDEDDPTPYGEIDSDNDGVHDGIDRFPNDSTEWEDADNDGIGDNADTDDDNDGASDTDDAFPLDPAEQSDTDADGIGNNADTDDDNDSVLDSEDAFPLNPNEQQDTDNDGVGNNADMDDDGDGAADTIDEFPLDQSEQLDSDADGIGNNADTDDDNDGVSDSNDAFPLDSTEQRDTDNDGIGNVADTDDDNDSVADADDAFPLDPNEQRDTDNDGIGNVADTDDDNDGVADANDAFPLDPTEKLDTDNDGIGNNADTDDDNDETIDINDAFPLDPTEQRDTDADGVGDNADAFPDDASETLDSDSDGIGDNSDPTPFGEIPAGVSDSDDDGVADSLDPFPNDATEWFDSDGDGVGNNADVFDLDPTETTDSDGDGVGDNADAFPNDATEQSDIDDDGIGDNRDSDNDNDGVPDEQDAFPLDPNEQRDTDADGIGDVADIDDDNDGVNDADDAFPQLAAESIDTDDDGIGDNRDPDDDNDGSPDTDDAFPLDPAEQRDTDGDGIGNAADTDDDNDGVADADDAFPELASESVDSDSDGTGDNADNDDDNDGIPDETDAFPTDAEEFLDTDNDGIGNSQDSDDDNDGYSDAVELQYGSDALDSNALPQDLDSDRDTLADSLERGSDADNDGIGNEFDIDSDNDGISDLLEASANPMAAALLDSDGDGSLDSQELRGLTRTMRPADTDRDGILDFLDLDSDNDGISDSAEVANTIENFISINNLQSDQPSALLADPDGDQLVNYRDLDSDNDGIPDLVEAGGEDIDTDGIADNFLDINADGMDDAYFATPLTLPDTDADGTQDYLDLDSDNDGRFDVIGNGLVDADLDGDGRLDISADSNGNGIFDYADVTITNGIDSDSDGIDDRLDASILNEADSDSDGIADRFDADSQADGFIQIVSIAYPEESPPAVVSPVVLPVIAPAEPVVEQPVAIATTGIGGGGCSVAGPGHPDMTLTTLLVFSVIYLTLVRLGTLRTLKSALLIFLSSCLAAGPTLADVQTGLYLGLGAGASRLMPDIANASLDDRDSVGNTWNATAGYQLSRTLGVELEYSNLGTTVLDPVGFIDYQDVNLSGLYHFGGVASADSKKQFSLFGRVGVGTIQNQSNIRLERGSSVHWLAGAGIQIPVNQRLSLRAEGVNYDADVSRFGLSLVYRMGRPSLPSLKPLVKRLGLSKHNAANAMIENKTHNDEDKQVADTSSASANNEQAQQSTHDSSVKHAKPYVLSAIYHQPYRHANPSIEELMKIEPAPVKRWVISEDALTRMLASEESVSGSMMASNTASSEKSLSTDQPLISKALAISAEVRKNSSVEAAAQILSDNQLLNQSRKTNTPSLATAMPAKVKKPISEEVLKPVLFEFDKSSISSVFKKSLKPLVDYLQATPDARVTLIGHTDSIGSSQYNQALSLRRARAVQQFLLQQGIDRKMIRLLGMGEKRPVQSNARPSGRKQNRRVNIVMD